MDPLEIQPPLTAMLSGTRCFEGTSVRDSPSSGTRQSGLGKAVIAFGGLLFLLVWQESATAVAPGTESAGRLPTTLQAADLAIRLIQIAFPEWKSEPPRIELWPETTTANGIRELNLVLGRDAIGPDARTAEERVEASLLAGTIRFAGPNRLSSVFWNGQAVKERERNVLKREVDSHPEWRQEDVIARVEEAGVKFGPANRRAFLARLASLDLTPLFGPVARGTIRSAEFTIRPPSMNVTLLEWIVTLERGQESMMLAFEPFEGRLVSASAGPRYVRPAFPQPSR